MRKNNKYKNIESSSACGVFLLLGCLSFLFADTLPNINGNFIKLFFNFNHAYTTGDNLTNNQTGYTNTGSFPCWQLAYQNKSGTVYATWPYEGEVTNSPVNSSSMGPDMDAYESATFDTFLFDSSGNATVIPQTPVDTSYQTLSGNYQVVNPASPANGFIYTWDAPGAPVLLPSLYLGNPSYPGTVSVGVGVELQTHGNYNNITAGPASTEIFSYYYSSLTGWSASVTP